MVELLQQKLLGIYTSMSNAETIIHTFELAVAEHRANVLARQQAAELAAEQIAMARTAEHEASIIKARTRPEGRNADDRANSLLLMLDEDNEYKEKMEEARDHRHIAADAERNVIALADTIRLDLIRCQMLCNLAANL